ncbi:MAG TPA: lipid-A-disaccharide synthase N-terminal domain-containing protein [Phycisphaerae bacterium]|jgi:lipid-A-disaccharide synthase-like uncharacterized protein|nr:lipid-A-disaccharide synthase N-terminal domain-containing protein [Phycisphaerae bacterium]HOL28288.1 lipid-A-disaccharide synthase N-terminal domain-containing protein [Phycisphaerae bacterium]HPP19917.1 lipid-A-disaccharide synthase N-terminal domain-containing protein [Phycisphaerae bacterium]HPU34761.1 lipid-A-disaccharide synthase N-terminal domain-containing protein [Phycisphaerae bacterium]HXK88073.1 lipid-A-disaccharide synthase N-terminal domain-containing protein [Phycisphaerae ba
MLWETGMIDYLRQLLSELRDPWVWFGLGAQGLFFMRFFWQWVVSERRKQSTIPLAFWYLSLGGALSTFVYAAGRRDPAIMLGQLPACFFYIRNLMLIHGQVVRRRRAGLPVTTPSTSKVWETGETTVQGSRP